MTGFEVSLDVALGTVSQQIDHFGHRAERRGRYLPKRPNTSGIVPAGGVGGDSIIWIVMENAAPAVGKIWNILGASVYTNDPVNGSWFGGPGFAMVCAGSPRLETGTVQTQAQANAELSAYSDAIGGIANATAAAQSLTFTRHAYWLYPNQRIYVLFQAGAAGALSAGTVVTFNAAVNEYDSEEILPGHEGGTGGMRPNRSINVLPEA